MKVAVIPAGGGSKRIPRKNIGGFAGKPPTFGDDCVTVLVGYELAEKNVCPVGYRSVDRFHYELLCLTRRL